MHELSLRLNTQRIQLPSLIEGENETIVNSTGYRGRNELRGMADWTERSGAVLSPLTRLPEVLKEFKRPPNPYGWDESLALS